MFAFVSTICSVESPGSLLVSLNEEAFLFCRCFAKIVFRCKEQVLSCLYFLNPTFTGVITEAINNSQTVKSKTRCF